MPGAPRAVCGAPGRWGLRNAVQQNNDSDRGITITRDVEADDVIPTIVARQNPEATGASASTDALDAILQRSE